MNDHLKGKNHAQKMAAVERENARIREEKEQKKNSRRRISQPAPVTQVAHADKPKPPRKRAPAKKKSAAA